MRATDKRSTYFHFFYAVAPAPPYAVTNASRPFRFARAPAESKWARWARWAQEAAAEPAAIANVTANVTVNVTAEREEKRMEDERKEAEAVAEKRGDKRRDKALEMLGLDVTRAARDASSRPAANTMGGGGSDTSDWTINANNVAARRPTLLRLEAPLDLHEVGVGAPASGERAAKDERIAQALVPAPLDVH